MSTGVYTSATQILTKASQAFQQVLQNINANPPLSAAQVTSSKQALATDLLGEGSTIRTFD